MKKTFYIKTALVALIAATGLSSCLKDDAHKVDFAGAAPLIELPSVANVGGSGGPFQALALDIKSTPSEVTLAVNLAAPKTLDKDVTVKLSVDQAALTAYNTENSTNYQLLPANFYSSTLSTVIKAGTNLANVVINVNSNLIDPANANYVLPLTITDGGGQKISNYKTVLYNVQVKNQYDGVYKTTGQRIHPILGPQAPFDYNVTMSTAGATAIVGAALADLKSDLKITVNPDNSVSLSSVSQPSVALTPGGVNKYDPATKTFTLTYYYNTAAPRTITQVLVKQ
jgi:hypothetical protein